MTDPAKLIACPSCDALYNAPTLGDGQTARCRRCHRVLIAPRRDAGLKIIALSFAISVLVLAAIFHPFLTISVGSFTQRASLLEIAASFSEGPLVLVAVLTIWVILLVPLLRTGFILYALVPLVRNKPPAAGARSALRWADALKPWAMTEIFAIGCAVALVKVAGLARLDFGPAFWMVCLVVAITVLNDRYMCTWSIWTKLDQARS